MSSDWTQICKKIERFRKLTGVFATLNADSEAMVRFRRFSCHGYCSDSEFLQTESLRPWGCLRTLSVLLMLLRRRGGTPEGRHTGRTGSRSSSVTFPSIGRESIAEESRTTFFINALYTIIIEHSLFLKCCGMFCNFLEYFTIFFKHIVGFVISWNFLECSGKLLNI